MKKETLEVLKVKKTGNMLVNYKGSFLWISKDQSEVYGQSDENEWNVLEEKAKDIVPVKINSSKELCTMMDEYLKPKKVKVQNRPHTQTLADNPAFAKLLQTV